MSQWRVKISGKQYGPYSLEKLKEIYEEQRVPPEAEVWHPEHEVWMAARDVPELNESTDPVVIMDDTLNLEPVRPGEPVPTPAPKASADTLGDYLAFRRMLTPVIIQIIFWISAVLVSLIGVVTIISGANQSNVGAAFAGFLLMVFGPIVVRIYCELLIVIFRMNETLTDIREELRRPSKNP